MPKMKEKKKKKKINRQNFSVFPLLYCLSHPLSAIVAV